MIRRGAQMACVVLGLSSVSASAAAQEVVAQPCAEDERTCQRAPIAFSHTSALPVELDVDTGWVPPNSPLQVHLWGLVAAHTSVQLSGALDTSWPDALTLSTPGDVDGGLLSYHYGVDIGAQAKFEVVVANQTFSWVGDIPYVPQVDFQAKADQGFDAWGWEPGVKVVDSTEPATLANVDLVGLVTNIPGFEGGFALDVSLDLEVGYVTDRMVIERAADGETVEGGDIDGPDQQTMADYPGGPSTAYDVHPEGRVTYGGTLHLYPSLYIKVLGNTQTLPLADVPVDLPDTEADVVFEPARVRVPLPDLSAPTEPVELGVVTLGETAVVTYPVHNAGDMPLYLAMSVEGDFSVVSGEQVIAPGETLEVELAFAPTNKGAQAAPLLLVSNDPDMPSQAVTLRGTGVEEDSMVPPPPVDDEEELDPSPSTSAEGGCGCHLARRRAGGAWWCLAAVALAAMRRRRRG